MHDTLYAQEDLHLQKARADIERNRKGNLRFRVMKSDGKPVPDATVNFQQTSHDFYFGAQPMGKNARYANVLRDAGLNYSAISFDWSYVEPKPGEFDWGYVDWHQDIQAQSKLGFRFFGSLPYRLMRSPTEAPLYLWCPQYWDTMSFPELQKNVYDHMRTVGSRYRDRVDLWAVLNEENLDLSNCLNLTWDQKIELVRSAIAGLKAGNPDSQIIAISLTLAYEQNAAKLESTSVRAGGISLPEYLNLVSSRGIGFDAIGLEFYYTGAPSENFAYPGLSLASESRHMDQYAVFGKPIFIEEVQAPSVQYARSTWWHRPWDEATQAEYVEKFYTIAFSKPLVREIGWSWGVSDAETHLMSGGLLDKNLKPKPAYFTLKNLIASWTTSGTGTTDANGELLLRGFGGDYDVTVTTPSGQSWKSKVHVHERKDESVTLTAPASAPAPTTVLVSTPAPSAEPIPASVEPGLGQIAWIIGAIVVLIAGGFVAVAIRKRTPRE